MEYIDTVCGNMGLRSRFKNPGRVSVFRMTVRTLKNLFLYKNSENTGKNGQNQLFQNSRNKSPTSI